MVHTLLNIPRVVGVDLRWAACYNDMYPFYFIVFKTVILGVSREPIFWVWNGRTCVTITSYEGGLRWLIGTWCFVNNVTSLNHNISRIYANILTKISQYNRKTISKNILKIVRNRRLRAARWQPTFSRSFCVGTHAIFPYVMRMFSPNFRGVTWRCMQQHPQELH